MISFYPGPSRVHDEVPAFVKDAYREGVLSINHRSEPFMDIARKAVKLMKQKLFIPEDYRVYFTTSATECWEIIAQSLIAKKSHHIFNGAFGKKWYEYTRKLQSGARALPFELEQPIDPSSYKFDEPALVCVTQNETSNGTQVSAHVLRQLRELYPDQLIAVDATSSMGGIALDFSQADVWFASVQKCFGLPAGLAIMVCSPRALDQAKAIGSRKHYNSLLFIDEMMQKWQTNCTPNVLGIYLLMRTLKEIDPVFKIEAKLFKRYCGYIDLLKGNKKIRHLVKNPDVHSHTVIPVLGDTKSIADIKKKAKKHGILLGEGYGDLKESTFRIANFPAIKKTEIGALTKFLGAV